LIEGPGEKHVIEGPEEKYFLEGYKRIKSDNWRIYFAKRVIWHKHGKRRIPRDD
jgi:hypothetical protein